VRTILAGFVATLSLVFSTIGSLVRTPPMAAAPGSAMFHDEEVTYSSGAVTLSGTLSVPSSDGPHAAVLLITGAGAALRNQFGDWPHRYAALGITTLAYDKRGCGASTGRFHDLLPIEDLAADALAGIAFLKSRPDVDANRIGLVVASQGGWVAPLVASRSRNVSSMVLISAPMLSVADNGLYEIDNDLRASGFPEFAVKRSRQLNRQFNAMILRGGDGWTQLRAELDEARDEEWFEVSRLPGPLPETPAPANLAWVEHVRRYVAFDPRPLWETTTIPVLALYGGKDVNVPARESAKMLKRALRRAGNRVSTVKLYPDADHHLKLPVAVGETTVKSVPGLEGLIEGWLLTHLAVVPGTNSERHAHGRTQPVR